MHGTPKLVEYYICLAAYLTWSKETRPEAEFPAFPDSTFPSPLPSQADEKVANVHPTLKDWTPFPGKPAKHLVYNHIPELTLCSLSEQSDGESPGQPASLVALLRACPEGRRRCTPLSL